MENKDVTFCCCKPSQKHFTGSYEKNVEVLDELQDTILKGRKVNKLWLIRLNLKTRLCLRE